MKIRMLAALLACGGPSFAAVLMEEFASPAPNAFGSPSFAGWRDNALNALENGLLTVGDPNATPAAYYRVTQEGDRDNIVTGFPSWRGFANPGTLFGAAFANELGNRVHFGVHILGNGTQFALSGLSFNMHSSDPGNTFSFTGNFGGPSDAYSATRIGINYGPDHIKGTADDVRISSGAATQTIDELIYIGVGNALAPDSSCPGSSQATLDCVKTIYDSLLPFSLTTDYSLADAKGGPLASSSASVDFPSVPEPASFGLALAGGLILLCFRKPA
jgi:hypothetical protein